MCKLTENELSRISGSAGTTYIAYTVVKGDTVSKIAEKFGTTVSMLEALNPKLLNDPGKFQPGFELIVPKRN